MSHFDDLLKGLGGNADLILSGKPGVSWVDGYIRTNAGEVSGHLRTHPNETTADNLGTDVDADGIPGFFDADANGDGLAEYLDHDGDGVVDTLDVDGDGVFDAFFSLGDHFH